jgi:hypothetical protein
VNTIVIDAGWDEEEPTRPMPAWEARETLRESHFALERVTLPYAPEVRNELRLPPEDAPVRDDVEGFFCEIPPVIVVD